MNPLTATFVEVPIKVQVPPRMDARITMISLLKPVKDSDGVSTPNITRTMSNESVMISTEATSIANSTRAMISNPRTRVICIASPNMLQSVLQLQSSLHASCDLDKRNGPHP